jgi:uncharacterized protein
MPRLAGVLLLIGIGGFLPFFAQAESPLPLRHDADMWIGDHHRFTVMQAKTPDEYTTGLMYHTSLPVGFGMWFGLPRPGMLSLWMKHCYLPLDMVFVKQHTVVYMLDHVPPCTQEPCPLYRANQPVDGVLELPAGTIQRCKLRLGYRVTLRPRQRDTANHGSH